MGICEPMTWFWGNLITPKDDDKFKDKDKKKINWSSCNVVLYLFASVLTAVWFIFYITQPFIAIFAAFLICIGMSVYSLIHFKELFDIDNEVNEAADHCETMQEQEKQLEAEVNKLKSVADEMETTEKDIRKETDTFKQQNEDFTKENNQLDETSKKLQQQEKQFKTFIYDLKEDSKQKTSDLKTLSEQLNDLLRFIKDDIKRKEDDILEKAFNAAEGEHSHLLSYNEFLAFLEDLPNGFKDKILNGEENIKKRFKTISELGQDEHANDNLVSYQELTQALDTKN